MRRDPVARLRRQLARYGARLDLLEREVEAEIEAVVARVAQTEPGRTQLADRRA